MTEEELKELEDAYAKSTQGEWRIDYDSDFDEAKEVYYDWPYLISSGEKDIVNLSETDTNEEDATYIVLSHNKMPSLLKYVRELERKNRRQYDELNDVHMRYKGCRKELGALKYPDCSDERQVHALQHTERGEHGDD